MTDELLQPREREQYGHDARILGTVTNTLLICSREQYSGPDTLARSWYNEQTPLFSVVCLLNLDRYYDNGNTKEKYTPWW